MSAVQASDSRRILILICVMLASFIAAIEVSIVATVIPEIVSKLGGFSLYSWVFAAFLLAQTVTTVLSGKLSDIYGRKPVIIGGIVVFLIGSILSGLSWSMPSLIAFRLIQGLGSGSIQPVAITIIGDHYLGRERFRIQGWVSTVWAIAAIAGPLAGGLIIQQLSWRWVFWVGVPVGLITIAGFLLMDEELRHKPHALDYAGAGLLSVAISALLVALTQSATLGWTEISLLVAIFVASTVAFLVQESRAAEPMISLDLWGDRMVARANGALMFGTMTLIGVTSMLPVYVQAVQGRSALIAGIPLSTMLFAWPFASVVSARILKYLSMRATLRLGGALIFLGAALLLPIGPTTSPAYLGVGPFIMGFGMGLLNITSMVAIQSSVDWSKRGSATSSVMFSRTLGNTFGVTVLGAVVNLGVVSSSNARGNPLTTEQVRALLGAIGEVVGGASDPALHDALNAALRMTFWAMLVFAAMSAALALFVPLRELDVAAGHGPRTSPGAREEKEFSG